MIFERLILLGVAVITAFCAVLLSRSSVHVLQLESYKLPQTGLWLARHCWKWLTAPFLLAVGCITMRVILMVLLPFLAPLVLYITAFVFLFGCARILQKELRKPQKKPLVYTMRVKRLYFFISLVALSVAMLLLAVPMPTLLPRLFADEYLSNGVIKSTLYPGPLAGALTFFTPSFAPLLVLAAAFFSQFIEELIKRRYFLDARDRLLKRQKAGLVTVGITGSFGKTSVKFILATLLGEKYNVLATPASFNTPMGVTRTIREMLKPEHEVFICEMGAKHVGDIAELCDLVTPQYGLITSIGKQHLDTFHTLDNIIKTKYELIEALPPDGKAFFPDDGGICRQLYQSCKVADKTLSGLDDDALAVRAEDIEVGPFGSRFTLIIGEEEIECETRLLGRHNILNIVNACAVAHHLDVSMEQIRSAVSKLEPVEHRLQIVPTNNGVTVIDDAFNSNPAGAKAAMDVLRAFLPRRIVVTPGMVELGAEEERLNEVFGRQIAESADIAILIGQKRSRPIAKGMLENGFDQRNLHVVNTLDEATALLGEVMLIGDTVLFENDLPDNYNE